MNVKVIFYDNDGEEMYDLTQDDIGSIKWSVERMGRIDTIKLLNSTTDSFEEATAIVDWVIKH